MPRLPCQFGESRLESYWFILLRSPFGTNCVLNRPEYGGQFSPYAIPSEIMLQLPCKFGESVLDPSWVIMSVSSAGINTLRPGQDGRHFADAIFTCIFINKNCCILIKFSLKYVRKDPVDNNPALVQIMAWRRSGDKPLSELPTHICVTRPQWVKPGMTMEVSLARMQYHPRQCHVTNIMRIGWINTYLVFILMRSSGTNYAHNENEDDGLYAMPVETISMLQLSSCTFGNSAFNPCCVIWHWYCPLSINI